MSSTLLLIENLRQCRGNLTEKSISRASQMVGQVTKGLDSVFLDQVSEVAWHDSHPSKKWLWEKEVKEYVDEHKNDHLFDFVPGREHRLYQGFQFNLKVSNPARFKKLLIK